MSNPWTTKAIVKFNNGNPVLLCNNCNKIMAYVSLAFDHEDRDYFCSRMCEINHLYHKIDELQRWMSENPGYIDGFIEKSRQKDDCYKRIQELEMAEWNL